MNSVSLTRQKTLSLTCRWRGKTVSEIVRFEWQISGSVDAESGMILNLIDIDSALRSLSNEFQSQIFENERFFLKRAYKYLSALSRGFSIHTEQVAVRHHAGLTSYDGSKNEFTFRRQKNILVENEWRKWGVTWRVTESEALPLVTPDLSKKLLASSAQKNIKSWGYSFWTGSQLAFRTFEVAGIKSLRKKILK